MLVLIYLFIHIVSIVSGLECGITLNGNIEITCFSYIHCVGGVATMINCSYEQAYNPKTQVCDLRKNVPPPCNINRNCLGKQDGRYYDIETNCTSYYTCHNTGFYYGHNFCSPGLVFDEQSQQCNWPRNVAPPCGTAPVDSVAIGRRR